MLIYSFVSGCDAGSMSEESYLGTKGASMTLDSLVIVNSNVLATFKAVHDYLFNRMWHDHLCF